MDIKIFRNPQDLDQVGDDRGLERLSAQAFQFHRPAEHWIAQTSTGEEQARCSLWIEPEMIWQGRRLGRVGHYGALTAEAGSQVLRSACHELIARGCDAVVGPMDGSTWFRYRLITERGSDPPFFLEPDHPPEWLDHFRAARFRPFSHYLSARITDLNKLDPRMDRVARRMDQLGIQITSLGDHDLQDHLLQIHQLCLRSFAPNFLYIPLDQERFLALYKPVFPYIEPQLIQLAYDSDRLVGFAFALPDWAQQQRGDPIDTLVIKTVAVWPGRRYAGLGNLLAQRCQQIGRSLGMNSAIHALMHEHNSSRNALGQRAHPFRHYSLLIWEPDPE